MSDYCNVITQLREANEYEFTGNTLIKCPIPDGVKIRVNNGKLVTDSNVGKNVTIEINDRRIPISQLPKGVSIVDINGVKYAQTVSLSGSESYARTNLNGFAVSDIIFTLENTEKNSEGNYIEPVSFIAGKVGENSIIISTHRFIVGGDVAASAQYYAKYDDFYLDTEKVPNSTGLEVPEFARFSPEEQATREMTKKFQGLLGYQRQPLTTTSWQPLAAHGGGPAPYIDGVPSSVGARYNGRR